MKASVRFLQWLPRMICIAGILSIGWYAVNSIESYLTIWQQILFFGLKIIPSVILIALLVIAWKKDLLGGVLFTLIGLSLSAVIYQHNYNLSESVTVSLQSAMAFALPLVFTGGLFIASYVKIRQYRIEMHKRAIREEKLRSLKRFEALKFKRLQHVNQHVMRRVPQKRMLEYVEED